MTTDHVGAILYPDQSVFRIIGRFSLPLFSYLLILGVKSTRNIRKYFARLFIFAIISQVPYVIVRGYEPLEKLNIFFTHSISVLFVQNPLLMLIPIFASLIIPFEFGLYGFAMIAFMNILKDDVKFGIVFWVLLEILTHSVSTLPIWKHQIFSLLALPLILLHKNGVLRIEREVKGETVYPAWRKYFFYIYYPLHLILLYLIKNFFF